MSECVVRMEMPHDGLCDLAYSFLDRTFCTIEGLTCKYCDDEARPDWCPILGVLPEKHGRLVDAAAIPRFASGSLYTAYCFTEAIADTPTIVPAERSEE